MAVMRTTRWAFAAKTYDILMKNALGIPLMQCCYLREASLVPTSHSHGHSNKHIQIICTKSTHLILRPRRPNNSIDQLLIPHPGHLQISHLLRIHLLLHPLLLLQLLQPRFLLLLLLTLLLLLPCLQLLLSTATTVGAHHRTVVG